MGDQNNTPLIKQKHRTENAINANKCELSKVQILLACFMQKRDASVKHILGCLWYVLQKIRRH